MNGSKAAKLWVVNIISFLLFSILGVTGLMNWLILPKGRGAAGSFLISLRHFFMEIHQLTALAFLFIIFIHLALHWRYIKSKLKK